MPHYDSSHAKVESHIEITAKMPGNEKSCLAVPFSKFVPTKQKDYLRFISKIDMYLPTHDTIINGSNSSSIVNGRYLIIGFLPLYKSKQKFNAGTFHLESIDIFIVSNSPVCKFKIK